MKLRLFRVALASATLACAVATPHSGAPTLENTHWTLASLGAARTPIEKTQTEAFIVLGADPARLNGSGGCNRLTAGFERKGDELKFGAIAATRMACEHGMEVEDALGAALSATASFKIVTGTLELYDARGTLLASLAARGS